jgi:hypothetical protein
MAYLSSRIIELRIAARRVTLVVGLFLLMSTVIEVARQRENAWDAKDLLLRVRLLGFLTDIISGGVFHNFVRGNPDTLQHSVLDVHFLKWGTTGVLNTTPLSRGERVSARCRTQRAVCMFQLRRTRSFRLIS